MRNFILGAMLLAVCALSPQARADDAGDIRASADFLEAARRKRGFSTRQFDNAAHRPLVFAPRDAPVADVLFCMHFDGQPVLPERWSQAGPFVPVVKQRAAGGAWVEVLRERPHAAPFDPELRVVARSASDDKAPIMMLLTAIDPLREEGAAP